MTVKRRVLYSEGGLVMGGHIWEMVEPWKGVQDRPVFVVQDQDDAATVYADHDCTERLGSARRGPRL